MKSNITLVCIYTFAGLLLNSCEPSQESQPMTDTRQLHESSIVNRATEAHPPVARIEPETLEIHGDMRIDPYFWMNRRDHEEVIAYLEAENRYTDELMQDLKPFAENLFEEMKGRILQTDESVPYLNNGYYYYTRFEEGKEYPVYCRKKGSTDAEEEILLDVNVMAEPHAYYSVGQLSVSPDNRWMVFSEDIVSRRIFTLRFKNLETGEILETSIPGTMGYAIWANDNKTIFYGLKDPVTLRGHKIMRHTLGTDPAGDVMVFEEKDDTFYTYAYISKSRKYIIIGSFATVSNEFHYIDADNPTGTKVLFQPRERHLEYTINHVNDHFYIRTNLDARNFRLMRAKAGSTAKDQWEEVIPHRDDVLLEGIELFNRNLVLNERVDGMTRIRIMNWDGSDDHYIRFDEEVYLTYTTNNFEPDASQLRLGFMSLAVPNTVYDYHMADRKLTLLKQQEVLGDFDVSNYETRRILVPVRDGTRVPVSMVMRKGTPTDGTAPLLLYGYGSYGYSLDPTFSSSRLSLLDRGFIFAIAHIRGGEEMGRHWYEDGKLLNKKNTFYDFIDCGQYLVDNAYADPDRLFASGGSAGGLLMGAVINKAPELFRGVVASVPFVDVVTTMLDESIPLTTGEYDEWGNPNVEEYYHYIKSYSPYDNVAPHRYPALMIVTGYHDSQVQYWEPAKWVAKLRTQNTGNNPILFKTNMEAGHSGASGRFKAMRELADEYTFLLDIAGFIDTTVDTE